MTNDALKARFGNERSYSTKIQMQQKDAILTTAHLCCFNNKIVRLRDHLSKEC